MAISEQKLRELAELEPPKFLERIADFLADLTMRTSAFAVFERQQTLIEDEESAAPWAHGTPASSRLRIGHAGLAARSFGAALSRRARFAGTANPVEALYRMLRPYQIGPYELRQFSMWLVRWQQKLVETEVLREVPVASAAAVGTGAAARPGQSAPLGASYMDTSDTTVRSGARRVIRRVTAAGAVEYYLVESAAARPALLHGSAGEPAAGPPSQPTLPAARPGQTPPSAPGLTQAPHEAAALETRSIPRKRADLPRTQPTGVGRRMSPPIDDETARPALSSRAGAHALWLSNLAMAGAAAGFVMGRSRGPATLAARLAAPSGLGVAGPHTLGGALAPPAMSFPLSHPPVSTASWLGAAAPAPMPADFVPMPGAPLPMAAFAVTQPAHTTPSMPIVTPQTAQPALQPARTALDEHRRARETALAADLPVGQEPVAVVMQDGTIHPLPRHPSSAPSRRPSPIPGMLAAGLAGFLLARLTSGAAPSPIQSDALLIQPIPSASGVRRARVFTRTSPGSLEGTIIAPGAPSYAGPLAPRPISGTVATALDALPLTQDLLSAGRRPMPRPGASLAASGILPAPLHPRLGEVTVISPPMAVASAQAERTGAAVAFDWPTLARAAGPLDQSGLTRLREALPAGAQALYPALPRQELPAGAVNLRLAPSLLKPLLTQAYGSDAAGIAGSAAAMASATAPLPPANQPLLGRLVPAARPSGSAVAVLPTPSVTPGGALMEAGAGQARRSAMLDFLGVPVRLAPSLGGRAELRDELAARGIATQGAPAQVIRPHVFGAFRQEVLPGMRTVQAEPDRTAWRKAAPHFGLRDAEPATVLSPDARISPVKPGASKPQLHTGYERPGLLPRLSQTVADRSAGFRPASMGALQSPALRDTGSLATLGSRYQGPGALAAAPAHGAEPFGAPTDVHPSPLTAEAAKRPPGLRSFGLMRQPGEPIQADERPAPWERLQTPDESWPTSLPQRAVRLSLPSRLPSDAIDPTGLHSGPGFAAAAWHHPSAMPLQTAPSLRATTEWRRADTLAGELGGRSTRSVEPARIGWTPPALPPFRTKLPQGLPGLGTVAHLGLPLSAVARPAAPLVGPITQPAAVAAPTLIPAPMPILASAASRGHGSVGEPYRSSPTPAASRRAAAPSTPGRLALTVTSVGEPAVGHLAPFGLPIPVMLPAPGMPMAEGRFTAPSLPLPGPDGFGLGGALPTRQSTSIVERAPQRLYAAVDAGPASRRRVVVQKAASEAAGSAGGPHQPMPSAQRAQRFTADTQRASVLASKDDGMTANEVHLLANDVWSILKRRLKWEADRRGRW